MSEVALMPSLAEATAWVGSDPPPLLDQAGAVGQVGRASSSTRARRAGLCPPVGRRRTAPRVVAVRLSSCAGGPFRIWVVSVVGERFAAPRLTDPAVRREHELAVCAHFGVGHGAGRAAEVAGRARGVVTATPPRRAAVLLIHRLHRLVIADLERFEAMALLIIFGFIAGAATALSPACAGVPIALSPGATGGRRRPLGIVAGLAVSFTFATVALVYVIAALGLPNDLLRKLAIVVLLGFGITLMIPPLAARLEAWISRFAGRAGVARQGRRLLVGRRGRRQPWPRLRALRRPDPRRGDHRLRLAVLQRRPAGGRARLRTRIGRGPLPAHAWRAQAWCAPLAKRSKDLQVAIGAVMVIVALAMLRNFDIDSRTRSPAICRASWSTRPKGSRTPPRPSQRSQTSRRPRTGRRRRRNAAAPREPSGGGCRPARARPGAGIRRQPALVQHPGRQAADAGRPARPGRPRRLLDLQLHQLHPHPCPT